MYLKDEKKMQKYKKNCLLLVFRVSCIVWWKSEVLQMHSNMLIEFYCKLSKIKKNMTFLYILDFCKFLFDSNATQSTKIHWIKVHCGHFLRLLPSSLRFHAVTLERLPGCCAMYTCREMLLCGRSTVQTLREVLCLSHWAERSFIWETGGQLGTLGKKHVKRSIIVRLKSTFCWKSRCGPKHCFESLSGGVMGKAKYVTW